MKIYDEELMNSEYITADEKGWHISDDAPVELKEKFKDFLEKTEQGIEIEII